MSSAECCFICCWSQASMHVLFWNVRLSHFFRNKADLQMLLRYARALSCTVLTCLCLRVARKITGIQKPLVFLLHWLPRSADSCIARGTNLLFQEQDSSGGQGAVLCPGPTSQRSSEGHKQLARKFLPLWASLYPTTHKVSSSVSQIKVTKGHKEPTLKWVYREYISPHKNPIGLERDAFEVLKPRIFSLLAFEGPNFLSSFLFKFNWQMLTLLSTQVQSRITYKWRSLSQVKNFRL